MPNLEKSAGDSWFKRWRKNYDMVSKKTKHLKVSWKKIKERVKVFIKNVFALRFFWRRLHADAVEMRWVSWDQKPAWFNNTALDSTYSLRGEGDPMVKEIETHARQRFTVCTCVDSATKNEDDDPPPVGILFKAAPCGPVWRELTQDPSIPAWMHVQTQRKGSYRAWLIS